jgi:hypothetical protein
MAKYLGFNGTHKGAEICYLADNDIEKNFIQNKMNWVNFVTSSDEEYDNAIKGKTQYYWNGVDKQTDTYSDGTSWSDEHKNAIPNWKVTKNEVAIFIDSTIRKIEEVKNIYSDLPNVTDWIATKNSLQSFNIDNQSWLDTKSDINATNAYDYLTKKNLIIKSPLQLI